jgi:pimeloyl-ACP methyl ester carboxylesterase
VFSQGREAFNQPIVKRKSPAATVLQICLLGLCWLTLLACSPQPPKETAPPAKEHSENLETGKADKQVVHKLDIELPSKPESQGDLAPLSKRAQQVWQSHLKQVAKYPLQSACQPFSVPAQGKYRGSVVLFHGFTACPQQFWEVSTQIAAQGFHVFVPLLPGHGWQYRQEAGKVSDDVSAMPADQDYTQYTQQATEMAGMLRGESGIKVVGGLSLGGVVAASAVIQAPDVFDRALLMTPLFDVVAAKKPYLPPANVVVPKHQIDWGPDCELERKGGRGGVCQFQIKHIRAAQRLGEETLAQIGQVQTQIQVVGVEGDHAANNESLAKAVGFLKNGKGCLYQKGVSHSMLSRFDSPDDQKFWLNSMQQQLLRFVESGQYFDITELSHELGLPRCHIAG